VGGKEPRFRGRHRRRRYYDPRRHGDIRQAQLSHDRMSARRPLQPSEETTMFDRQPGQAQTPSSTSAAQTGSLPPERVMRIAPLDLRQQRFRTALRGFDRTEVVAFLTEAADDYEHA